MNLKKIKKYLKQFKILRFIKKIFNKIVYFYNQFLLFFIKLKNYNIPVYSNPTENELKKIENDFINQNIQLLDFYVDLRKFEHFIDDFSFPPDYHGGIEGDVL